LLGIEIDGDIHKEQEVYDTQRDEKLRHLWIKIIRYSNEEVTKNINEVISDIQKEIEIRRKELGR
jgi:5-methyltetrahydrofolate--homocysteine methyltransferase